MLETEIKEALIAMQVAMGESDSDGIMSSLGRLDQILAEHRKEIDPLLRHFLENRSYQKALKHLEGEGAARGSCG